MTDRPRSLAVLRSRPLLLAVTLLGLLVILVLRRLGLLDEILGDLDDVEDETLDCE